MVIFLCAALADPFFPHQPGPYIRILYIKEMTTFEHTSLTTRDTAKTVYPAHPLAPDEREKER